MYLNMSALVGIGIALVLSTLTIIYALAENYTLQERVRWLQQRNRELNKQLSKSVEVPF